jgi:hypothetical protein
MSMIPTRRAHGDSHYYTADGNKYKTLFIDARERPTYPIYSPNKAQMLTAVKRIDVRYKHRGRVSSFLFWTIRKPLAWIGIAALLFALIRSL